MVYKKYPFRDNLSKEEYLKFRVDYNDVGTDGFIVTDEVKNLMKVMMAYDEQDRPEWKDLFEHKFFAKYIGTKIDA
jgi:hypothetical protein